MAHKFLSKVAIFTAGVALGMVLKDHVNFSVKTDFEDEEGSDENVDDANHESTEASAAEEAGEPVVDSEGSTAD